MTLPSSSTPTTLSRKQSPPSTHTTKASSEFYTPEDVLAGVIEIEDRMGILQKFPLSSLSMGIVTNQHRDMNSPAEASSIAAEMKHFAKMQHGSNYQIDRRLG